MKEVKPIHVTVSYVGKDNYAEVLSQETVLQAVKLLAMKAFELELLQESKYALQFLNADQNEAKKLQTYQSDRLSFVLVLIEEPNKG